MGKMSHDAWLFITLIILEGAALEPPQIDIVPTYNTEPLWKTPLTVVCKTQGWSASPAFFWNKDDATLYPYQDSNVEFSTDKSTIILKNLSRQNSGSYSCVAIDLAGYIFERSPLVTITVQEPPYIPTNIRAVSVGARSVTLTWDNEGEIEVDVYKVILHPDGSTYSVTTNKVTINNLTPYTIYSFTVTAINNAGDRGESGHSQLRTDTSEPEGNLKFVIGTRTSDSLELSWDEPTRELAGGEIQNYLIEVYLGGDLVESYNVSAAESSYRVTGLQPETQYTLRMCYTTQCCVSSKSSKYGGTVAKGVTVPPPSLNPVTDGNKAPVEDKSHGIIGLTVGILVFLIIAISVVAILCYRKKRRDDFTRKAPRMHRWNDGTQECGDDLVPVSPPPQYTRDPPRAPPPPLSPLPSQAPSNVPPLRHPDITTHEPSDAGSTANSSVPAQNASLSRSFSYNPQVSPPPAYSSRSYSSDNNSTISTLSNVNGEITELLRNLGVPDEKEQNVPQPEEVGDTWI